MNNFYTSHMDIKLLPRESVFDGLVLREKVDELTLHKLINSDLLQETQNEFLTVKFHHERDVLRRYRRLTKNGYAHILYSKKDYGRCSAMDAISYFNIYTQIRHSLAGGLMVDLDIENCHPVLMVQMLDKYGFKSIHLRDYVNNRDKYLKIVRECWELDTILPVGDIRKCCKTLFIRLMYGGTLEAWEKAYKLAHNENVPSEISNFINEFITIMNIFMECNPELVTKLNDKHKKQEQTRLQMNEAYEKKQLDLKLNRSDDYKKPVGKKISKPKFNNVAGSITSTVMQEKECIVLECLYLYLRRRLNTDVMSLCADGVMISADLYHESILREMEVEVFCKLGFVINMSEKKMDNGFTNIDDHIINNIPYEKKTQFKLVDEILNRMKNIYKDFTDSNLFHESMTIIKERQSSLVLKCSSEKCLLCDVKHKKDGECYIKRNEQGNFALFCHSKSKVFKKSIKSNMITRELCKEHIEDSINDFFFMDVSGERISVIHENSTFIGCNEDNEIEFDFNMLEKKFLIIQGAMGKGKTSYISALLQYKAPKRILFISQRKTFTNFVCSDFKNYNIVNYTHITNGNYNVDRLCIQIESLHKVTNFNYDFIIIDESETVLNQFSSSTMVEVRKCWDVLRNCIDKCSFCVLADAFILNRSLDFVKGVRQSRDHISILINDKPFLKDRKCIQVSQDKYNDLVVEKLKDDKRIISISGTREDLLDLGYRIKEQLPEKTTKIYEVRYLHADKNDLCDVNTAWSSVDFVGYTPVIQTGVSYMGPSFDLLFMNLKRSNLPRDQMQMALRARNLKDNTVYFSISKRQIYNTGNKCMFDNFQEFKDDRMNKTDLILEDLYNETVQNDDLIDMVKQSLKSTDEVLTKIMYHNLREYMLSQCHFNSMVLYMLKKQGYDVQLLGDLQNEDRVKEVKEFDHTLEYNKIAIPTSIELESLKFNDDSTSKMMADKYFFEKMTVAELDDSIKSKLFFDYYLVSHKKKHLTNIKYEKSNLTFNEILELDFKKNDDLINKLDFCHKKLKYVKHFNRLLGLKHSCHSAKIVPKRLVTGPVLKFIKENEKQLTVLYNSKIKLSNDPVYNNMCSLKLIQKVYKDWSGMEFKKYINPKKKSKEERYITHGDNFFYYLTPYYNWGDIESQLKDKQKGEHQQTLIHLMDTEKNTEETL